MRKHLSFFTFVTFILSLMVCSCESVEGQSSNKFEELRGKSTFVLNKDSNITIEIGNGLGNADIVLRDVLKRYLLRVLKKETLAGEGEQVTFILKANAPDWQDLDFKKLKSINDLDAFEIDTTKKGTVTISGTIAMATGYGVMYFLEHYMGVFWLFPGELGKCIPDVKEVRLPILVNKVKSEIAARTYTGIRFRDVPRLIRLGQPLVGPSYKNRTFFWAFDALMNLKLSMSRISASHNLINVFPIDETKEKNPEIFPVWNGVRISPDPVEDGRAGRGQCWHPCFSNKKTLEVAIAKALKYFEEKRGLCFSLGVNDGAPPHCQCELCAGQDPALLYFRFVNNVAKAVKEVYPAGLIGVLGYGMATEPVEGLKMADNVYVLSRTQAGKALADWGKALQNIGVYEYPYGWGYWRPNFPLKAMKQNALLYRDMGVSLIHDEMHPLWAFDGPKVYIRSNLLWDADFDVDQALERYCRKGFGKAWKPVWEFYKLWASYGDKLLNKNGVSWMNDFDEFRHPNKQFGKVPESVYKSAREYIQKAKSLADNDKVKKRLEMLDAYFGYSEVCYKQYHAKRQTFETTGVKDWLNLTEEVNHLYNRRLSLIEQMKSHQEWSTGTMWTIEKILIPYATKGHNLGHCWEGRWEWTLDYEAVNALRTALFQANRHNLSKKINLASIPEEFHLFLSPFKEKKILEFRIMPPSYTYYSKDWTAPMLTGANGDSVTFEIDHNVENKRVRDDYQYKYLAETGFKKPWFRGDSKLDQKGYYYFDLNLEGYDGKVRINICNENDCGKTISLEETFDIKGSNYKKQLLLKPVPYWGNNRSVVNWSVEIIFTPNTEKSDFKGTCTVKEIEFS